VVAAADPATWARSNLTRLSEGICRRAFSSPEALLYEATIAESLRRVVRPALAPHIRGRRVLDVGSGGGRLAMALAQSHSVVGIDPPGHRSGGSGVELVRGDDPSSQ
jgi:2-polyprenyl-3-methyl-5-hydroxy-6-metoxy-1,4-benzoquinol methylase